MVVALRPLRSATQAFQPKRGRPVALNEAERTVSALGVSDTSTINAAGKKSRTVALKMSC